MRRSILMAGIAAIAVSHPAFAQPQRVAIAQVGLEQRVRVALADALE